MRTLRDGSTAARDRPTAASILSRSGDRNVRRTASCQILLASWRLTDEQQARLGVAVDIDEIGGGALQGACVEGGKRRRDLGEVVAGSSKGNCIAGRAAELRE